MDRAPLRVVVPADSKARLPFYHMLMNPSGARAAWIGWVADPTLGPVVVDGDGRTRPQGGFRTTDEVVTLPVDEHYVEYVRHVRDGDLDPADDATAKACDVPVERVPKAHVAKMEAAKKAAEKTKNAPSAQ